MNSINKSEPIEINENDYVRDLIQKIKTKKGINEKITLHCNGEILEEDELISSYDIEENSCITYMGKFPNIKTLFISDLKGMEKMFKIYGSECVGELKQKIKTEIGINKPIRLLFNGTILEDDDIICNIGIRENDHITYMDYF